MLGTKELGGQVNTLGCLSCTSNGIFGLAGHIMLLEVGLNNVWVGGTYQNNIRMNARTQSFRADH